jgi:hypothetical protein
MKIGVRPKSTIVVTQNDKRLGMHGSWSAYAAEPADRYPIGAEVRTTDGEHLATVQHGLPRVDFFAAMWLQAYSRVLPRPYLGAAA